MSAYDIAIKSTLLETKHYEKMGIAIWLFIWLLDKTTKVDGNKEGKVLGGKPIRYEDVAKDIKLSRRTYERYISRLEAEGYVSLIRTPYGLRIVVKKAHKYFGKRSDKSGTSGYATNGTTGGTIGTSLDKNGTSNKTIQLDNTIRQLGEPAKMGAGYAKAKETALAIKQRT